MDTEDLARGYALANNTQRDTGVFLLDMLGIARGMHVLDVGCGPGDITARIAELVGEEGRVVGIDPSKERIAIALERATKVAKSQNLPIHLHFEEGRAEDLSRFPSDGFDAVFVNSTLHWVQDQPKALREFARVLRAGGRLGISGGSGDFEALHERIKKNVLSREPYRKYPELSPPKFLKKTELEDLLDRAGFGEREILRREIVKCAEDEDDMLNWLDTSSSGRTYGGVPMELRPSAREEMKREWEKSVTEEGIKMVMEVLVTVAVKR
jgi:ubiquinone/menaquinone biosynthesis C-methylase UbiE